MTSEYEKSSWALDMQLIEIEIITSVRMFKNVTTENQYSYVRKGRERA